MIRDRITKEEKKERGIGMISDHDLQVRIPASKLRKGNITDKILVPLSDGKTFVCVHPKKVDRIHQIKNRYEKHQASLR